MFGRDVIGIMLRVAGVAAAGAAFAGCADDAARSPLPLFDRDPAAPAEEGRLTARPLADPRGEPHVGLHPLGLTDQRDALLYVPASYRRGTPAPMVVMLHGAGGCAERGLRPFIPHAESEGLILLATSSRDRTWDVIVGDFGPDVAFLDRALKEVFERYSIDEDRLAVEGFSDGASYALTLGVTNGDLFSHVIAFSPGFMAPGESRGKPPIFISHGVEDRVLPIDVTSRKLVPELERRGYDVNYIEFQGGHAPAPDIVRDALGWFLGTGVGAADRSKTTGDDPC
ncbi:MAG: phospholipase [Actinomycetota bacterium]|nr:phospholipase [Actinomycetota bacterium]